MRWIREDLFVLCKLRESFLWQFGLIERRFVATTINTIRQAQSRFFDNLIFNVVIVFELTSITIIDDL